MYVGSFYSYGCGWSVAAVAAVVGAELREQGRRAFQMKCGEQLLRCGIRDT